jgi:hypothetical protein
MSGTISAKKILKTRNAIETEAISISRGAQISKICVDDVQVQFSDSL